MNSDGTIESLPPAALREAVAVLWAVPPPGPPNLFSSPQFIRLRDICADLYPNARAGSFALGRALDSLGLPCRPPPANPDFALNAAVAAARLHAAFQRSEVSCLYLCPLDKADRLPDVAFGPNRIARLSPSELEALVDLARLRRINATWTFDAKLLSEFTWLAISDTQPLIHHPEHRAIPLLFENLDRDWGAIEPHRGRFPAAVEDALFAMLLAPWEDWVDTPNGWWRPFEVPWSYAIDNDLFIRSPPPPSADRLSWDYTLDDNGEGIFVDPNRILLKGDEVNVSEWLNDSRWARLARLQQSRLFETPIKHFFVKAFLEMSIDEFLAHMLTIEAALGLESDYRRPGATKLMAARVSALLSERSEGKVYCDLFNLRSTFLHGRKMDAPIPGEARLKARRLARRVVRELVETVLTLPSLESREDYLKSLAQ